MKGIKKLSFIALSLAFVVGMASCAGGDSSGTSGSGSGTGSNTTPAETNTGDTPTTDTNTGGGGTPTTPTPGDDDDDEEIVIGPDGIPVCGNLEQLEAEIGELSTMEMPSNYGKVYINEENKLSLELTNLSVYDTYARTTFYLGESYNDEGLVVIASFRYLDENGVPVKTKSGAQKITIAKVSSYIVDTSAVDTNTLGGYTVGISFRYGGTVKTSSYRISVKSSEFETTANLDYCAGFKIGYKEEVNSNIRKLTNDGRILTTYQQRNNTNNFTLNISDLKAQIVRKKVNSIGSQAETSFIDYDLSTCTNDTAQKKISSADGKFILDYSEVNTGVTGSYKMKVTYDAGEIEVSGRKVQNTVSAFIVVDVISPVIELTEDESSFTMEASMGLPDLSNYTATVVRQYLNGETLAKRASNIAVSLDNFTIEGLIGYKKSSQTATFKLKELTEDGQELKFQLPVNVTESTKYNIQLCDDISTGTGTTSTSSGKLYYNDVTLNSVVKFKDGVDATNIGDKSRDCTDDGMIFKGFAKVKGTAYVEFTIDKPATLILYVGSNGDDEREFAFYNMADDSEVYRAYTVSGRTKQYPNRHVVEITQAGTYKLVAIGSDITFHGYVLGTKK